MLSTGEVLVVSLLLSILGVMVYAAIVLRRFLPYLREIDRRHHMLWQEVFDIEKILHDRP